jgi:hypothetical protein
MTTEELDHDIDTITQTVFDMINENGTKGVSAILAALVTCAEYTDNTKLLAELLNITTEMLKD